MGCGCGSKNKVTEFEVRDSDGGKVGSYPTRAEAATAQANAGAGATIRPVVKQS